MKIDWAALGSVFGVSLVVTVALVGLFTLGIVGLSKQERGRRPRAAPAALAAPARTPASRLCAAAVAYGIYLIVA